ncbi:hypothetical protein [Sphingomonas sp. LT1P40]|uniref:hypothetical protein n=1 Tax=Alteristakelama amylovorans TaxID=3096166 RepID=UPI002FCC4C2D
MPDRDPHPDSLPQDNHDTHIDVEQATSGTNRDITNVEEPESGITSETPDGVDGAVGGTGGVTKNQDDTAQ